MIGYQITLVVLLLFALALAVRCWTVIRKVSTVSPVKHKPVPTGALEDHLNENDVALLRLALERAREEGREQAYKEVGILLSRSLGNLGTHIENYLEEGVTNDDAFITNRAPRDFHRRKRRTSNRFVITSEITASTLSDHSRLEAV